MIHDIDWCSKLAQLRLVAAGGRSVRRKPPRARCSTTSILSRFRQRWWWPGRDGQQDGSPQDPQPFSGPTAGPGPGGNRFPNRSLHIHRRTPKTVSGGPRRSSLPARRFIEEVGTPRSTPMPSWRLPAMRSGLRVPAREWRRLQGLLLATLIEQARRSASLCIAIDARSERGPDSIPLVRSPQGQDLQRRQAGR